MSEIEYAGKVVTTWAVHPADFDQPCHYQAQRVVLSPRADLHRERGWATLRGTVSHGHEERVPAEISNYACLYIELSPSEDLSVVEVVNEAIPTEQVHFARANSWNPAEYVFLGVPAAYTVAISEAVADILGVALPDPLRGVRATIRYGAHDVAGSSPRIFDAVTREVVYCCLREARGSGLIGRAQ